LLKLNAVIAASAVNRSELRLLVVMLLDVAGFIVVSSAGKPMRILSLDISYLRANHKADAFANKKDLRRTSGSVGFVVLAIVRVRPIGASVTPTTPPPLPTPGVVSAPPPEENAHAPKPTSAKPKAADEPTKTPTDLAREFRAAAEPERRGELVGELWEIGTPEAVETLRQLYFGEREMDVKVDIISG
jgi:hypothetical protein